MALLLLSCSTVKIKDAQICADIGTQGATCDNFLASRPTDIPQPEWDDRRFGMLCISPNAWGDIKNEIEELCSVSHQCSYETQQAITAAISRINQLEKRP